MAAGKDIATKVQGAPDVAVFCDATLAPCLRALGVAFPAPVHVFSAPPPLMLAQIARETQTDLLVTLASAMDEAARLRLVRPETRYGGWQTQLVLAAAAGDGPAGFSELPHFLASGNLAVTDPTDAATFDGYAVIARLNLPASVTSQITGAANTDDVAYLVETGAARLGLVHLTDVKARPSLRVFAELDLEPIRYAAAVAKNAKSQNTRNFLAYLQAKAVQGRLPSFGLEVV